MRYAKIACVQCGRAAVSAYNVVTGGLFCADCLKKVPEPVVQERAETRLGVFAGRRVL